MVKMLTDKNGRKFQERNSIVDEENHRILTEEGWKYWKINFWGHRVSPNGERLHWFNSLRDAELFVLITEYPRSIERFAFPYNYTIYDGQLTEIF
jgi:hypothetical protein